MEVNVTSRIRLLIEYSLNEDGRYSNLSIPQVLYNYFKKEKDIEVVSGSDPFDIMIVFSGGSHTVNMSLAKRILRKVTKHDFDQHYYHLTKK